MKEKKKLQIRKRDMNREGGHVKKEREMWGEREGDIWKEEKTLKDKYQKRRKGIDMRK